MRMPSWFVMWGVAAGVTVSATAAFVPAAQACTQPLDCRCSGIPSSDTSPATVVRARVGATADGDLQLDVLEHIAGPKGAAVGESIRVTPVEPTEICEEDLGVAVGDEVLVAYEADALTDDDAGAEPSGSATHHGAALVRPWNALPFEHDEAKYLVDADQCQVHFSAGQSPSGCRGDRVDDDDGCSVASPGGRTGSPAWWFVAAAALWLRRRHVAR